MAEEEGVRYRELLSSRDMWVGPSLEEVAVDTMEVVLLVARSLMSRVWVEVREAVRMMNKLYYLVEVLRVRSTQTLTRKPDLVEVQEEPDTSPSAQCYAAAPVERCSRDCLSAGCVDQSRKKASKNCRRP